MIIVYILCIIIAIIFIAWGIKYYILRDDYKITESNNAYRRLIDNKCFKNQGYENAAIEVQRFTSTSWNYIGTEIIFLFAWGIVFLIIALIIFIVRLKSSSGHACQPV